MFCCKYDKRASVHLVAQQQSKEAAGMLMFGTQHESTADSVVTALLLSNAW